MKKSAALPILLLVVLLVIAAIAEAQQPGNCADRVLSSRSPDAEKSRLAAFQQGLQELGYLEGKNALIEQRQLGGESSIGSLVGRIAQSLCGGST
jgi:hypothetical protein